MGWAHSLAHPIFEEKLRESRFQVPKSKSRDIPSALLLLHTIGIEWDGYIQVAEANHVSVI
jgi:hypothetical protein